MARDPYDCSLCGANILPHDSCVFELDLLYICLDCFAITITQTFHHVMPFEDFEQ